MRQMDCIQTKQGRTERCLLNINNVALQSFRVWESGLYRAGVKAPSSFVYDRN